MVNDDKTTIKTLDFMTKLSYYDYINYNVLIKK